MKEYRRLINTLQDMGLAERKVRLWVALWWQVEAGEIGEDLERWIDLDLELRRYVLTLLRTGQWQAKGFRAAEVAAMVPDREWWSVEGVELSLWNATATWLENGTSLKSLEYLRKPNLHSIGSKSTNSDARLDPKAPFNPSVARGIFTTLRMTGTARKPSDQECQSILASHFTDLPRDRIRAEATAVWGQAKRGRREGTRINA